MLISSLIEKESTDRISGAMRNWRIIDPACGDGELLSAIWFGLKSECKALTNIVHQAKANEMLCGIDIDTKALRNASRRLNLISDNVNRNAGMKLIKTNALFPFNSSEPSIGWARIKQHFNAQNGFDVVIANPPWGANVTSYRHLLNGGNYSVCKGQFDTADLFFEFSS